MGSSRRIPAAALIRVFWLLLLLLPAWPAAAGLTLSLENIRHPALTASKLRLELGDTAVLRIGRLVLAGHEYVAVRAECPEFSWRLGQLDCPSGLLTAAGHKERLPFSLSLGKNGLAFELSPGGRERWHLLRQMDGRIRVNVREGRLERLGALLPLPAGWRLSGRIGASLFLDGKKLGGEFRLTEAGFADPEGLHAGEKMDVDVRLDASHGPSGWRWQAETDWRGGEVFWQPAYARAEGQTLRARGRLDDRHLAIDEASLDLPGIGQIAGGAEVDRSGYKLRSARLESAGLDLNRSAEAFLAPILAVQGWPEMELAGRLSFVLGWDGQGLSLASLGLDDVAVREKRGRFSATGIFGGLPWRRLGSSDGYLSLAAAQAGDFRLGAFRLPLAVAPDGFAVAKTEIPLLDSQLNIDSLAWRRIGPDKRWEGELGLSLNPVSLAELTRSFGLPVMSGSLSASFPRLRYREGAAYLEGALVIQVFEGFLNCTHLRLENPFGPLPRLTADVEAHNLNLGQLTETFSFGRIEGFADGEIQGLELVGWRPQRFDARLVSSPGDYRKRISQRAVQDISSLGGAGAGAAIQASFLRIFEEFGYDRIGLSCRLENGVCEMGGVEEAPKGYVLVKGGGIPSLTVIGYNRRVDWPVLVERLMGIIHDKVSPQIR